MKFDVVLLFKINELRYNQCEVTPHFSNGQSLLKKNIEKRYILKQSIEKNFLVDPLNTNNAIYCDSLTLIIQTFCLTFILGQLPQRKIFLQPKLGAIFLGGNCPDTLDDICF